MWWLAGIIVVSVYGIFVIETKNYRGWITGSEFLNNGLKICMVKSIHLGIH